MATRIEWCDESWNPIKMRCTKVSEGCQNCYAERLLSRNLPGFSGYPAKGEPPRLDKHILGLPLLWKKPRRIFVESMGDLFHRDVPTDWIISVFEMMAECPQHTFVVCTKRPERLEPVLYGQEGNWYLGGGDYLPNVILMTTTENQEEADKRIPAIMKCSPFMLGVSVEPMLGPVDLGDYVWEHDNRDGLSERDALDWVICGGETGPKARPMEPEWALNLLAQCLDAGVPYFFKKWSAANPKSLAMPRELPANQ